MHLWFAHGREMSIRGQLAAQVVLAILGGDLGARSALAKHPRAGAIAGLFSSARRLGIPLGEVRLRLRQWLEFQTPEHFLLIEPDAELRKIIAMEMQQASSFPVKDCRLHGPEAMAAVYSLSIHLPGRWVRGRWRPQAS